MITGELKPNRLTKIGEMIIVGVLCLVIFFAINSIGFLIIGGLVLFIYGIAFIYQLITKRETVLTKLPIDTTGVIFAAVSTGVGFSINIVQKQYIGAILFLVIFIGSGILSYICICDYRKDKAKME